MKNICRSRNREKKYRNIFGDKVNFIPQCCFLIYGNRGKGKTSLCYYLTHMFKEESSYSDCSIILVSRRDDSKEQECFVRFGENDDNENKKIFYYRNKIPPKKIHTFYCYIYI